MSTKKLKDMVKGRTPTPSRSGNQFSIQPVDQLPPNSLLAKIIKPVPPVSYDGSEDSEKFERFGLESAQFCKEGQVPKDEQVFLVSHYLEGKAQTFFVQKVAKNHSLFNFCFSANFRFQQQDKLQRCHQNGRTVSEYVYELENLMNHVGVLGKHEKVIKLWDGFSQGYRYELHRAKLSKEVHSWKHIFHSPKYWEWSGFLPNYLKEYPKTKSDGQKPTNGRNPKLSDAKRAEFPRNNIVRSGSSGPPGISARAMQFPLRDENSEMLAQLAEITEPVHELTLNMMAFGSFTNELSVVLGSDYLSESETIIDSPIISDEPPSIPPYPSANEDSSLLIRTNSDFLEFFKDGVGDGMPALESVSDSESDDDDDVLQQRSDSEMESEDEGQIESDSETLVSSFNTSIRDKHHTWIDGNLGLRNAPETFLVQRPLVDETRDVLFTVNESGQNEFSYADVAKDIFGYPNTMWSDFFLHKTIDHGWWPASIDNWMCLAMSFLLNHDAPYPADELWWGAEDSYRFHVNELDDNTYGIEDDNSDYGELTISRTLLLDPSFKLSAWYAQQRAEWLGHLFDHVHWRHRSKPIGDVYKQGLKFVLTHGIPAFPASPFPVVTDPFQRFEISKISSPDGVIYQFEDKEARIWSKPLPISILRNTRFNLVRWWKKHLTKYISEQEQRFEKARISHERKVTQANKHRIWNHQKQGEILALAIEEQLELAQPFPGDSELLEKRPGELWNRVCASISGLPAFEDMDYQRLGNILGIKARNSLARHIPFIPEVMNPGYSSHNNYSVYRDPEDPLRYVIVDDGRNFKTQVSAMLLMTPQFNLPAWYNKRLEKARNDLMRQLQGPVEFEFLPHLFGEPGNDFDHQLDSLANAYIEPKTYPGLQRNAGVVKDIGRIVPRPIVIVVQIDGRPKYHKNPLSLHLAIQGSRSKIHCGTTVNLKYATIDANHYFDIANISNYDLILGTPWIFQYKVRIEPFYC
ncbi:hypothetical protein F5876DRAFT_67184 [Lentinula aff. lateritia]|uniref:Uncharacterized protein n=1 Tax=Lentinula aff. lateritia TaxID=2804960 RepID=A0ACC1TV89_9AGAR|nr:hypothetical protein F5876DRAFT_67184 [Lentinula aff. lateritia]